MTMITCSIVVLVILGETYCKTTATVNKTSSSWGYDYNLNDTNEYKVQNDVTGFRFEPLSSNTSSTLKKHSSSKSVYDKFTSPETDNSQLGANGNTSNDYTNSGTNAVSNKINTQTDTPVALNSSQGIVSSDTNGYPSFPANGPLYRTSFGTPYSSPNSPMYGTPSGPSYYPQTTAYGQMYSPTGGSMYGIPNGQMYGPTGGSMYGIPNGQMYGPTGGSMYAIPNGQMYRSPPLPPTVPMYGYVPQNDQTYYSTGSSYGSYRNY